MNIRSVNTGTISQQSQPVSTKAPDAAPAQAAADTFEPAQTEQLVKMLQEQPDVRPDAVELAKSLASDPDYPSANTVASLARLFVSGSSEQ
jgi:hypothetical protein